MISRVPDAGGVTSAVTPATPEETRAVLLKRSKRTAAPIAKPFIQNPVKGTADRRAPLAEFVNNGDLRGLQAFCFLHAIISSGDGNNGWSTTLPIRTWARAFGFTETATPRSATTAASKVLARLEGRRLIARERRGKERQVTITLLRPDGTGAPYERPLGATPADRFVNLSNAYWLDGWHAKLDLPALAMLLVALHEKPHFELVAARVPAWYGWSADTAERGFKQLEDHGLLRIDKRTKKEPLAPDGITTVNVYTLLPPFDRQVKRTAPATPRKASKSSAKPTKRLRREAPPTKTPARKRRATDK